MNICVVTHKVLEGDGQGKVNYEVVKESISCGYQITLIASQIDKELEQNELVTWVHIPVKGLPTEIVKNIVFSHKASQWLKQHHQEFDIIKVNGSITNFSSDVNAVHFVHSSWLKSPVHTWQQNKNIYGFYQLLYTAINAYWEKQAFSKSKAIVAVSENVKQELIAIGVPPDKIKVIVNGVDLKKFQPGRFSRQDLGLPDNVLLAFFVGDIRTPRKNLDTVLKALANVPDLHLAIAGSTEDSPYLELAANLNISDRTHFLGYRIDISELMRAMDMFVFPSRYEPFGMVISEAMATELPVVTTRSTGVSDIVTPESGIVLADTEDVEELEKALKKLVSNCDLRKQMGLAGRNIVEHHSWITKAKNYIQLFEDLIAS
ncbi:MAG: glycosyltransferase family 4 protein [Cyanobacteria bacterium J06621_8]